MRRRLYSDVVRQEVASLPDGLRPDPLRSDADFGPCSRAGNLPRGIRETGLCLGSLPMADHSLRTMGDAPRRPQPALRRSHQAARHRPQGRVRARPSLSGGPSRPVPASSTSCSTCRRPLSTVRHGPRSATLRATRSSRSRGGCASTWSRPRRRPPFKAVIEDETGDVTLVFFRNNASWVEKGAADRNDALGVGPARTLGRAAADGPPGSRHGCGRPPRHAAVRTRLSLDRGTVPPRSRPGTIEAALERVPQLGRNGSTRTQRSLRNWPAFDDALRTLHRPEGTAAVDVERAVSAEARLRRAAGESTGPGAAAQPRQGRERPAARSATAGSSHGSKPLSRSALTGGQKRALDEIRDRYGVVAPHAEIAPGRRRVRQDDRGACSRQPAWSKPGVRPP